MVLILINYFLDKLSSLLRKNKMEVLESLEKGAIDASYEFTSEQGLSLAAMLSAFDNEYNPIDDPRYGRIVFGYRAWGFTDDGDAF